MITVKRSPCRMTWQLVFRNKVIHVEHSKSRAESMAKQLTNKFSALVS